MSCTSRLECSGLATMVAGSIIMEDSSVTITYAGKANLAGITISSTNSSYFDIVASEFSLTTSATALNVHGLAPALNAPRLDGNDFYLNVKATGVVAGVTEDMTGGSLTETMVDAMAEGHTVYGLVKSITYDNETTLVLDHIFVTGNLTATSGPVYGLAEYVTAARVNIDHVLVEVNINTPASCAGVIDHAHAHTFVVVTHFSLLGSLSCRSGAAFGTLNSTRNIFRTSMVDVDFAISEPSGLLAAQAEGTLEFSSFTIHGQMTSSQSADILVPTVAVGNVTGIVTVWPSLTISGLSNQGFANCTEYTEEDLQAAFAASIYPFDLPIYEDEWEATASLGRMATWSTYRSIFHPLTCTELGRPAPGVYKLSSDIDCAEHPMKFIDETMVRRISGLLHNS